MYQFSIVMFPPPRGRLSHWVETFLTIRTLASAADQQSQYLGDEARRRYSSEGTNFQEEEAEKRPFPYQSASSLLGNGVHPHGCRRQMVGLEVTVWSCLRTSVVSEQKAGKSMVINSEAAFLKALGQGIAATVVDDLTSRPEQIYLLGIWLTPSRTARCKSRANMG